MKKAFVLKTLRLILISVLLLCTVLVAVACNEPVNGLDGKDGKDGKDGVDGKDGATGEPGKDGAPGAPGKDGINGTPGKDGEDGQNGKSAYELALEDGFEGSLHEWLLSLAVRGGDGADGKDGEDGEDGKDGEDGIDGVGVSNVHISADGSLIVTLTDGTQLNAGKVGSEGANMGEADDMGFTPVYEMVVKGSGDLNLRDHPGTGNVVTVVSEGDELLRIGIQEDDPNVDTDGYSRFLINGVECYARSHYFTSKYTYQGNIPTVNLPDHMVLTAGERHWFVTDQIVLQMDAGLTVHYAYSGAGERVYDGTEAFAITPSAAGTATLTVTVQVIDNGVLQTVCQKTVEITVAAAEASLSAVGMIIGDSRVSDGEMVNTLQTTLPNLTLLGTRTTGSSTVRHEGRGGWSADNYVHDAQVSISGFTLTNPFYNPTTQGFDFAYYMEQNYPDTVPNFVVIHLGPNDGYSADSVENVKTMVASIKAYGTQKGAIIRVLIMTEYLSPAEGYLLAQAGNTNMTARRLKQFAYFALQSKSFEGREAEQIYLLPNYLCVNGWSDWSRDNVETLNGTEERITDTVHLGTAGYRKAAGVIRAYLFYLLGNDA